MKKRLIATIMFCMVMFAGCSMIADKDAGDVFQEVDVDNPSEQPIQDAQETPTATDMETSQEVQEVAAESTPYSADAQKVEGIVTEFCAAYFGGDLDSIKTFLADQYIWDIEVYENSANKVEVTAVTGLEDIGEKNIDDVCVVSVEYKEEGMDTYLYLTVEFIKTDKGWKIEFYGNEG
ncbi:MAG: hypothetical protein K2O32_15685 [Acetatifactor sp.]|nr:hypothetical protein [Acetatifactor sp.]